MYISMFSYLRYKVCVYNCLLEFVQFAAHTNTVHIEHSLATLVPSAATDFIQPPSPFTASDV